MSQSVFSTIVSYTPTPYMNPQENFLTELFAWVINNVSGFGNEYVRMILQILNLDGPSLDDATVSACTQITVLTGFIDMVIYTDKGINFICEHKIDSELSDNQINKYLDCTNQLDGDGKYYSVLLTKAKWQHTQDANVSIVWKDIDVLIDSVINNYEYESANRFMLEQFSLYLKENGLGKVKPMDAEYYKNSYVEDKMKVAEADARLVNMFREISLLDWKSIIPGIESFRIDEKYKPEFEVKSEGPRCGRVGIRFFKDWIPSIFAGVLYDGSDHKLELSDSSKGPDLVVLLDIDYKKNKEFNSFDWTKNMKARLSENHEPFAKFVGEPKNPWRLAVLQMPFYDVISGCDSYDEQKNHVVDAIKNGIDLLFG